MVLPAELPSVHCSACGAEVREGDRLEVRLRHQEELAHHRVFMECAQLV